MRKLTILLFVISLLGCKTAAPEAASVKGEVQNLYFSDASKDYVYKTAISVYGHNIGGILYLKKTSETAHRLVLTTEFGNTLLDGTLENGHLSVNSIVDELDRKILLKTLEADFRTVLREKYEVSQTASGKTAFIGKERFGIEVEKGHIVRIIRSKRKKIAEYAFLSENDTFADKISIVHHDLNLQIELTKLDQ